jgi:putative addiction module component (TIGR02574 family)
LPAEVRAGLAERLLISIDAEESGQVADAWRSEIERRAAELDAGRVQVVPGDEVRKRVEALISGAGSKS